MCDRYDSSLADTKMVSAAAWSVSSLTTTFVLQFLGARLPDLLTTAVAELGDPGGNRPSNIWTEGAESQSFLKL
jgi:hypothetical protein